LSTVENLKQAVALVPGEAKYQYGLGRVHRDEEMIDEAREEFAISTELYAAKSHGRR